jgi:hypothetical protein
MPVPTRPLIGRSVHADQRHESSLLASDTEGVAKQLRVIGVVDGLRLRPYGGEGDVGAAWPWYRDIETMRLIDGKDAEPYTRSQVKAMYQALSAQGEVYMIEERSSDGAWEAIGDVTLAPETLPIVLR